MRDMSGEFFIFQQDSAPARRASDTVRLNEQATPAFIPPDLWPPNSTDLNSVDYNVWDIVQQRVYQSRVHNIDELNQRLLHVWHGIDQTIIDMQVTSCVGVIAHVCRQKADTSSNYYNNIQPYDKRRFIFVKCYTIFRLFLLL